MNFWTPVSVSETWHCDVAVSVSKKQLKKKQKITNLFSALKVFHTTRQLPEFNYRTPYFEVK